MKTHKITSRIDFHTIENILSGNYSLALSAEAKKKITRCRNFLEKKLAESDEAIYGINTGFGALYDKRIPKEELNKLQKNLVMSHACGVGEEVPREIVKLMLLLKIQGLSLGYSGIRMETVERLIDFYNNDVLPVIYQQGSLGASGDLAPLAHLSLPLIGLGEVNFQNKKLSSESILKKFGWKPLKLQFKEGLALLNGTQFMSAYSTYILLKAQKLSEWADLISAISLDAFDCRIEPFNPLVHEVRPHKGQVETAKNISSILKGSQLIKRKKNHVQDPYSFRCIPQVHGASRDVIEFATNVFHTEINSVTDNPTIFPGKNLITSAGNFHGQQLALSLDSLCLALSELGSISERRVYKLLSGQRGLPPFLVANPGLNSGLMIPQYVAASLVSQNKQLSTPASVDSIDSSNGQEDHVSMGANAATKCFRILENLEKILAIEFLASAQALDLRKKSHTASLGKKKEVKSSPKIEKLVSEYRQKVGFIVNDKPMYVEINKSLSFLRGR